jgi:hypothetical protein
MHEKVANKGLDGQSSKRMMHDLRCTASSVLTSASFGRKRKKICFILQTPILIHVSVPSNIERYFYQRRFE